MNKKLKANILLNGTTQKDLAGEMGMHPRTFYRKASHMVINGCEMKFNEGEKEFLARRLGMKKEDIQ